MTAKKLLFFYFRPLMSYAQEESICADEIIKSHLWFIRERKIENYKVIEQFKKLLSANENKHEVLLIRLIIDLNNKEIFNFGQMQKEDKQALLNLVNTDTDLASYATSLLITLLLRDSNLIYRITALKLLKKGKACFSHEQHNYSLKIENIDLIKNFYIDFSYIKFTGITDKIKLNFSGQCLRGLMAAGNKNLKHSSFRYACLQNADLKDATLDKIDFSGSHLGNTNFSNSLCKGTHFERCYLTKANFTGADIRQAHFENAELWLTPFTEEQKRKAKFSVAFTEIQQKREDDHKLMTAKIQQVISKEQLSMPDQGTNWPSDPLRWKRIDPWGKECEEEWCELEKTDDLYAVIQSLVKNTSDTMSYTAMFWEPARLLNAYKKGHLIETMAQDFKKRISHQGVIESILVDKIYVIRNPRLWKQFQQRKQEVEEDLSRRKISNPLTDVKWHGQPLRAMES